MAQITQRTVVVINAIRHSMQVNAGPGSSINQHPNPYMLQVLGEVDLLKAAEQVLKQLGEYDQAQAKQEQVDPETRAAAVDGH